jgi:hypothetical protein
MFTIIQAVTTIAATKNNNNNKPNALLLSNRNLQPIQKPIEVSGVDESVKQKLNSRFSELNNNTQDFDYSDFDF